jgi:hypothetical protein
VAALLAAVVAATTGVAVVVASPASAAVSGRNLPANGKVRFFMGQDSSTLSDYKRDVLDTDPSAPRPGGVTLYTNIFLGGIYGPVDYGSGSVDFPTTLGQYPDVALAVGLYLSDSYAGCGNQPLRALIGRNDPDVTSGDPSLTTRYRQRLDELITWLKNTGREVFLRIGYEYDGPWNCYNAGFYKEAFRYVKGRIDALGATKVATVWQSASWPVDEQTGSPQNHYIVTATDHFDAWYPGDQYVDWVAMSAFYGSTYNQVQWTCRTPSTSPRALQDRILAFARARDKPVMIAEAAPQGFATGAKTGSCISTSNPQPMTADAIWNTWYADFFAYVAANTDVIRAVAYINTHWDSQAQWRCTATNGQTVCPGGYWGDSRVQADPTILSRFLDEVRNARYVGSN